MHYKIIFNVFSGWLKTLLGVHPFKASWEDGRWWGWIILPDGFLCVFLKELILPCDICNVFMNTKFYGNLEKQNHKNYQLRKPLKNFFQLFFYQEYSSNRFVCTFLQKALNVPAFKFCKVTSRLMIFQICSRYLIKKVIRCFPLRFLVKQTL